MELKYDLRLGNRVTQGEILELGMDWTIITGGFMGSTGYAYNAVIPLDLNEDILINNLGFEKCTDHFEGYLSSKGQNKSQIRIIKDKDGQYMYLSNLGGIILNYVHEVQNLYQDQYRKQLPYL